MGFDGYLSLGGIEILNAQRTAAYVHNISPGMPLVRRTSEYDTINLALGEPMYRTPMLDGAPWTSPPDDGDDFIQDPSFGFYGLYPLEIQGIGDSTMTAKVTEAILDGGYTNAQRDGSRSIRVRGILLGSSVASVEYGLTWLRSALRANACAMHGDGCGYTDLRYFLANPDICDPLFVPNYQAGELIEFGVTTPETSPIIFSSRYPDAEVLTEWLFAGQVDGALVRWGTMQTDSSDVIESFGPVYIQRSNFIVNPRLTGATGDATLNGWTATDATVNDIGSDDWVALRQDDGPRIVTNWMPDPSFENGDPITHGWRSSGGLADVVDGTAPQGTHVAVIPATVGGNWIETSILGPILAEDTGIFSFWKRHDSDLTITVTNNEGVEVFSDTLVGLLDAWERVLIPGVPVMQNYVVRVASDGGTELRLDGFMVESASEVGAPNAYFDGDTADTADETYFFVGSPSGPSRLVDITDGDFASVSLTTPLTDAPATDGTLTFYAAMPESEGALLVELLDNDDQILGSTTVNPGPEGARYALTVGYGRKMRPRFTTSAGELYIGRVSIEAGAVVNPYFDGDSTPDEHYEISWEGAPGNSISRMVLDDPTIFQGLMIRQRIFMEVLQGSPEVSLGLGYPQRISIADQLLPVDRTYHKVRTTIGVQKIREHTFEQGAGIEVDFTLTAGNPHAFSTSSVIAWHEDSASPPPSAPFDDDDWPLPAPLPPIIDPDLPPAPTPPTPPPIPDIAVGTTTEWTRYYIDIPAYWVPLWSNSIPTLTLLTNETDVREVRVRFHANPFGWDMEAVDPTNFCGEFLLSYLPANSILTVNGVSEEAWASVAGGPPQPANHLLYGTDGGPMEWPELSCNVSYVMTVDIPPAEDLENLGLRLELNYQE